MGLVGRFESYVFLDNPRARGMRTPPSTGMLGLSQSVWPKWGLKAADDLQRRTKGSLLPSRTLILDEIWSVVSVTDRAAKANHPAVLWTTKAH